ncbi:MAG TPA: ABC transporter substrate-binding protein [Acetobacteraceae bacterium]|jgi:branched-chain amino acid transport system substrate-binding protein|nr:ABC transporter substrate-binding protein [Acetobacteraceae bacterium]
MRALLLLLLALVTPARSESRGVVIGVIDDMSGPLAALAGPGDVTAAQMAVADFGGDVLGQPIKIVSGDHQNKPDLGAAMATQWYDRDGVTMITGLGNSAVALAVQAIAKRMNRIDIVVGASTEDLTRVQCSPTGAHWANDVYSLAEPVIDVLSKQGAKMWYFLVSDYAFGHQSANAGAEFITRDGGKILGTAYHPFGTSDYATYLLQAKAAQPDVLFLINSGTDASNSIKQATEFGLPAGGVKLASISLDISDVHAIGLAAAQGTYLTLPFYWNDTDETRMFAKRFMAAAHVTMPPTQGQASVYSAVLHYLKAVKAAGTAEAPAVIAKMRALPVEDFMTHGARLRGDGRLLRENLLYQVKSPSESTSEWDVMKLVERIPGDRAFRPEQGGGCPVSN